MKTNKLWSIMMMLVLVLGITISFSSCSKDDESDIDNSKTENNSIIGTWIWQETEGSYLFRSSYTFNADNTFTNVGIEKDDKYGVEGTANSRGTYIYTASKHELILIDEYASEKMGTHYYTIILEKNSFTLIEKDGDKCGPYIKQ